MVESLGILAVVSTWVAGHSLCFNQATTRLASLFRGNHYLSDSVLPRVSDRKVPSRHRAGAYSTFRLSCIRRLG